jgi:SagB-type dehydrogenase family enzyme
MNESPLHLFEGVARDDDNTWELFHENSKTSRYAAIPPDDAVVARMQRLWEALPYERYPRFELPPAAAFPDLPLAEVMARRETARALVPRTIRLEQLATMLNFGYGVTRDLRQQGFPRAFRVVPSGGALYPLELYFYSSHVDGLAPGIYHYNAVLHDLRFLRPGDFSEQIERGLVEPALARGASLLVFTTAIFERSVFKYGDRGYRFVLLEAGHVAQNMNLAVTALGLGCVNMGGYFDRNIDSFLEIDGLTHSCIYMMAVGGAANSRDLDDNGDSLK